MPSLKRAVAHKEVDWSALTDGFTISNEDEPVFLSDLEVPLERGDKITITLLMDGREFPASLVNINNSQAARPRDRYQVRYIGSEFKEYLCTTVFTFSHEYFVHARATRTDKRRIVLPEDKMEYLVFTKTTFRNVYEVTASKTSGYETIDSIPQELDELSLETLINGDLDDTDATIIEKPGLIRYRSLNRNIALYLKDLYSNRCQICGAIVGEAYGTPTSECHHIDYFSSSHNNSPNNQIVLCPNHHRIIHRNNPLFLRGSLAYSYKNGLEEKLLINHHLTK